MLRHLEFFEELASLEEGTAEWRVTMAGLVVLRLVDTWIEDGGAPLSDDSWTFRSVASAVNDLSDRPSVRSLLQRIIGAIQNGRGDVKRVVPPLMAFAQGLEYDAKWHLAADVYRAVLAHLHPVDDAQMAVTAYVRLGTCHRNLDQIDAAAHAFASAGDVASASGDMDGILRARIGEARVAFLRGNLPHAELILDETIATAHGPDLLDIRSRALHDRSEVAQMRGDFELSIRLAYDAMQISQSQRERDRILGDIATAFLSLGVYSAARDAYLVLSVSAQEQYVRWTALINLLDVASATGSEMLFEQYHRQLAGAALPPTLSAAYNINTGEGYQRFGDLGRAQNHFERAYHIALEHGLNRVLFMAEDHLKQLSTVRAATVSKPVPLDLEVIATAIREMRETAGAA